MKRMVFALVTVCIGSMVFIGCMEKMEKVNTYRVALGSYSAVTPVLRPDSWDWWTKRHQSIVEREKNAGANKLASAIADNRWTYYIDIKDKFLNKDGVLSKDIMPDFGHPNAKGYQIEAETIEPMVKNLMGETKSITLKKTNK